jgi:hypothetical protein
MAIDSTPVFSKPVLFIKAGFFIVQNIWDCCARMTLNADRVSPNHRFV